MPVLTSSPRPVSGTGRLFAALGTNFGRRVEPLAVESAEARKDLRKESDTAEYSEKHDQKARRSGGLISGAIVRINVREPRAGGVDAVPDVARLLLSSHFGCYLGHGYRFKSVSWTTTMSLFGGAKKGYTWQRYWIVPLVRHMRHPLRTRKWNKWGTCASAVYNKSDFGLITWERHT